MTLPTLISRLEGGNGADREIDGDLWLCLLADEALAKVGWKGKKYAGAIYTAAEKKAHIKRAASFQARAYTSSIDAALALVERLAPSAEYELTTLYGIAQASLPLNYSEGSPQTARRPDGDMARAILTALLRAIEDKTILLRALSQEESGG